MGVAQLVERWIVVPVAEGSNPSTHPNETNGLGRPRGFPCRFCHGFCNGSEFLEVALKLPTRIADVPVAAHGIAPVDRFRLVAADRHGGLPWNTGALHVAHRGTPQVVEK